VRATGATKEFVGAINEPVSVGGVVIKPGDVVVLDADGSSSHKGAPTRCWTRLAGASSTKTICARSLRKGR
jgi:hypothetical protein